MPRPNPALLLATPAVAAALLALPTPAGSATRIPGNVKTRIAKVQITVKGYMEMRKLTDTTSDCYPGESWTQTNRFDFDTRRFVNISLQRVTGDGFDPVVTSPFTIATGAARVAGGITGYKTTNYCTSPPVKNRPEPTCAPVHSGRVKISLQEVQPPASGDEELTPLSAGNKLQVVVFRTGIGLDDPECVGGGPNSLGGAAAEQSIATTSIAPGVAVALPAGITTIKLFGIRRGQTFHRTAIVSGPCSKPTVRVVPGSGSSPAPGPLNADSDCQFAGKLTYTIRPRPLPKTKG